MEIFVGSTAPHAHLIEWGTAERFHNRSGKSVGIMQATPFFTNAWDRTKRQALRILVSELETRLVKAARTLRRKSAKGTLGKRAAEHLSR